MREIEIVLLNSRLCDGAKAQIKRALEDFSDIREHRFLRYTSEEMYLFPKSVLMADTILHHFPSLRLLDEVSLRKYFDEDEYEIIKAYRTAIDIEGGIRNASSDTLERLSRANIPLLFRIARKAIPLELSNVCFGSLKFGEQFLQKELEEIDKLVQQLESGGGKKVEDELTKVLRRINEKIEDLERAIGGV